MLTKVRPCLCQTCLSKRFHKPFFTPSCDISHLASRPQPEAAFQRHALDARSLYTLLYIPAPQETALTSSDRSLAWEATMVSCIQPAQAALQVLSSGQIYSLIKKRRAQNWNGVLLRGSLREPVQFFGTAASFLIHSFCSNGNSVAWAQHLV